MSREPQREITVLQRVDAFVGDVMPKDRRETLLASLPAHVKPERFERNLVVAVQNHPKLLGCDPQAVFNEVAKAAALGLYLDPTLGEAYLITGWSGAAKALVPQLRLGYRGLIKLGRQSGEIASVYAHAVHENDMFKALMGTEQMLVHEPDYMRERGEVVLYYAVVKYRDGTVDFEPMSIADIHTIRDRSDGYRAWLDKKISSTPWATDEGEMAKKTVLRRLMKRLPQSPEIGDALQIENDDFREVRTVEPPSLRQRLTAGHTAPKLGFQGRMGVDRSIAPSDVPEAEEPDLNVDDPAPTPPVVKIIETPSPKAEPSDPLEIDILAASPDEIAGWAEAFKATGMRMKAPDDLLALWKKHFEDRIKPLYEIAGPIYDGLDEWMQARIKKLRAGDGQ